MPNPTNPAETGINEFFTGLAGHLGARIRRNEVRIRTTDGHEPVIGDHLRYHGSLTQHHGNYVVMGYEGEFADELMVTLGRNGRSVVHCNPSSTTTVPRQCTSCWEREAPPMRGSFGSSWCSLCEFNAEHAN